MSTPALRGAHSSGPWGWMRHQALEVGYGRVAVLERCGEEERLER